MTQQYTTTAEKVAAAITQSGFWPGVKYEAALMLCFLAEAEGHHPAIVYRDYHIMQGKPSKKAEAILRDFIAAGGKIKWNELSDTCADATFTHASGEARIAWDIARAKKAGLTTPMWTKYPRQMLRSRVISEGVRTVYPGATSGLYEQDEVADILAETTQQIPPAQAVEVTADGQIQTGAVSHQQSTKAAKGWREPDSPYSTPSKLHAEMCRMERELEGCGDSEMVYALTRTDEWREFVRISEMHTPHYLHGGEPAPEEWEGLITKAERLVREFDSNTATAVADLARV